MSPSSPSDATGLSGPSPSAPDNGDERPTSSRRAFLGRAAVGAAAGGLVWAAPSILTVDAAAAASCGTGGTLNWATATPPGNPTSITVGTVVASINHNANGVGSNPNFAVQTGTFGGQTAPWYQMQMEGAQTNELMTVTFTFSKQVNGLSFRFFDIDQNANANTTGYYRDVVWVTGTNSSGTAVGTTPSNVGNLTGAGTAANPFLPPNGGSNVDNGSGNGNATITFNGPVQTVTITYQARAPRRGNGSAYPYPNGANNGWSSQRIGIGNMAWTGCT